VPDKENAKHFTGTKKCGVVRRGNGFSHDLADRTPSRRTGGGAVTVCYVPFAFFKFLTFSSISIFSSNVCLPNSAIIGQ